MQFIYFFKTGMPVAQIEFKTFGHSNIATIFERLGGKQLDSIFTWEFPPFITSNVIKQVIHKTCFVCGGLMKDSQALQNTLVSANDFGNDAGSRGTTQSRVGPATIKNVRKCTQCGHSHT